MASAWPIVKQKQKHTAVESGIATWGQHTITESKLYCNDYQIFKRKGALRERWFPNKDKSLTLTIPTKTKFNVNVDSLTLVIYSWNQPIAY